jgi:choline monooxygenase
MNPRPPIRIDADIARSDTLPGWAYADPATHERAVERVFARSWQWVGDAGHLRAPDTWRR